MGLKNEDDEEDDDDDDDDKVTLKELLRRLSK